MNKGKLLFVYNPCSGKRQMEKRLADVLDVIGKANYDIVVHSSRGHGDITQILTNMAAEYSLVVCSGGDGTLQEVVSGILKSEERIPIGYIPSGSTNDYASSLGISKDVLKASETVVRGRPFAADVGVMNGKVFTYVAAFGLFTRASYRANQRLKNHIGYMAYVLEAMRELFTIHSYKMKVICDNFEIEDAFMFGMITNSISIGGIKGITGDNVQLNDGLFEVTLVRMPDNPLQFFEILFSLANTNTKSKMIYRFKTTQVSFFSKSNCAWTLDGEYGGTYREVTINNLQKAIDIIC